MGGAKATLVELRLGYMGGAKATLVELGLHRLS